MQTGSPKTKRAKPSTAWKSHTGMTAWPTVITALVCLGGWATTLGALASGALPAPAALALNFVFAYIAFTPMHEATHGNIGGHKSRKWMDEVLGWPLAVLFFAPYSAFRLVHLRHHGSTNDPDRDPDFWVAGQSPLTVLARCFTIVPHYYWYVLFRIEGTGKQQQRQRLLAVGVGALLLAIAAALVLTGYGHVFLWGWFVPGVLAGGVLALVFDWLPHHPHSRQERYRDTRAIVSPVLNLVLLWQNLHLIHHLYPRVPFYRYGRVFDAVRPELIERGSEIVTLGATPQLDPAGSERP